METSKEQAEEAEVIAKSPAFLFEQNLERLALDLQRQEATRRGIQPVIHCIITLKRLTKEA